MQLFTNPITTGAAVRPTEPKADAAGSSSGDTSSASITANDFLQLLVSELHNQDPTANTDPNEYINQLVQVNSLEQLIQINQDLTPGSTSSATGGFLPAHGAAEATANAATTGGVPASEPGNLSAPAGTGASSRVADALAAAGQTVAPGSGSTSLNSLLSTLKDRAQQDPTSASNPAQ